MPSRLLLGVGVAVLAAACAQSDPGITTSVKGRLVADELVRARNIDVDTRDGIVTLKGEVRTAGEEAKALEIARNTAGVADVVDQIDIVPEPVPTTGVGGTPREPGAGNVITTDPNISAQVKATLLADPEVAGLRIDVDTQGRVVTLSGSVRTQAEKSRALQLAREVEGVLRVTDKLTIEARR